MLALHHDDVQLPEDDFGHRLLQAWVEVQVQSKTDEGAKPQAEAQQQQEEAAAAGEEDFGNDSEEVMAAASGPATRPPRHDSQSARPQKQQQQQQQNRRHSETDPLPRDPRGSSSSGSMSLLSKLVGPAHALRTSSRSTTATARKNNMPAPAAPPPPSAAAAAPPLSWDPDAGDSSGASPPRMPHHSRAAKRWTHPYDSALIPGPHARDTDWALDNSLAPSSHDLLHPNSQQAGEDGALPSRFSYALGLGSHVAGGEAAGMRSRTARRFGSNSSSECNTEQLYADREAGAWYADAAPGRPFHRPGVDSQGASPRFEQGEEPAWPMAPLVPGTPAQLGHVRIHQQAALGTAVLNMCSTADALRVSAAATSAAVAAVGGRVPGLSGLASSRGGPAAAGGGAAAASVIGASRAAAAAAAAEGKPSAAAALVALMAAAKGRSPLASSASPKRNQQQQQQLRHLQQQQQQQQAPGTPTDYWQRQLVVTLTRRRHSSGLEAVAAAAAVAAQDAGAGSMQHGPGGFRAGPTGSPRQPITGDEHDLSSGRLHQRHPDQNPDYSQAEPLHPQQLHFQDLLSSPQRGALRPSARAQASPSSPCSPSASVAAAYSSRSYQLQAPSVQQPVPVPSTRHEGYSKAALLFGHRRAVARLHH